MAWSFPVARLLGSEIRIHVTFLLLLAWIAISHYQQGGTPAAVEGVLVCPGLLFSCSSIATLECSASCLAPALC
jgi:hypothetical protein